MKIEYSADGNIAVYCGYKFRRDPKTGYYLCTKNTDAGKRERLHVFVWRQAHGDIPPGYHVHHKDEDKRNNEIENLVCTPGVKHSRYHLLKYDINHHKEKIENLNKNVRPKASEWHKSEDGRVWHSLQAKENAKNIEPKEFVCEHCGKHFWKKPFGVNKYCSNNCKSAARRKSGVDDETRICACCGKEFKANRYANKRFCSTECRHSKD